jgi:ATP-dependent protease ClpP protease subunit
MEGNIYITGDIGTPGVSLLDVVSQVKKFPEATSFNVHINSPGGCVETGFDIYNYLVGLNLPVKTIGSTCVASIATVIFMAGSERVLRAGCEFMIHLPSGSIESATADQIVEYADFIRSAEKRLTSFYTKITPNTEDVIYPLLRNETFLTSEQAITLGFATSTDVVIKAKAKLIINTNNKPMTPEDKSWIENLFSGFETKIKNLGKKATALLTLTGADGTTIVEFADVAPDAMPTIGDIGTVDGSPATGSILMADGNTYVFNADGSGALAEIEIPEDPTMDALRQENEDLKQQLATAQAEAETATKGIEALQKDFKALKSTITSKFTPAKNEPKKGDDTDKPRSLLKNK